MFLMRSTESQDVSMFFAARPVCLGALGPWGLGALGPGMGLDPSWPGAHFGA